MSAKARRRDRIRAITKALQPLRFHAVTRWNERREKGPKVGRDCDAYHKLHLCKTCGGQFMGRTGRKFCSIKCVGPALKERHRSTHRAKRAALAHERRARIIGRDYEAVDVQSIYTRDGWVCGICKKPVDEKLSWPDELSASIDHVIALAAGGHHVASNLQCSHLICNIRKGIGAR